MGKVLGLDYGTAWVGVAIGERGQPLAFARPPIHVVDDTALLTALTELIRSEGVLEVVVGHPRTLAGGRSAQTERTEAFAEQLRTATGVPVTLVDERLSSVAARRVVSGDREHSEAARLILEMVLTKP
jgi:putative Holliday junction resolvase